MPAAMTYDSLVTDISDYTERSDQKFLDQIPRFIMLAENRIASECRGLGYQKYAAVNLNASTLEKPARWRETISISYVLNGEFHFVYERSYEYCRVYGADPTVTGSPKYYANYDYEHFFFTPTPDVAYSVEVAYYERSEPLSDSNQVNWTTQYAPQLLLYACLLETAPWLKNSQRIPEWKSLYEEAKAGISQESERRMSDRSFSRNSE